MSESVANSGPAAAVHDVIAILEKLCHFRRSQYMRADRKALLIKRIPPPHATSSFFVAF
jgi:hypothetical protein